MTFSGANEYKIPLLKSDESNIVIFTQNSLRHRRFALRLQQEFGTKVVAWFEIIPNPSKKKESANNKNHWSSKLIKHSRLIRKIFTPSLLEIF